jgi:putative endonuclease
MYYTYIIQSQSKGIYYKGISQRPEKRLWEHNNDMSRYTAGKGPWVLVYLQIHETKREALIAEKKLKKAGSEYLQE